ncbi:terpene cyclase/mutase family protein [Streptomyces sp. KM273126]|uniref:prenyltransferase/squalene oxidase repeat-containing protein n=1 Tax=Streptomyces sp. KM273126 TaxID=2545247 RepID=UPI00103EAC96|nr:prenyltransferase/squalene oxidase repeat-containing protein [Streptomyces sp. KM273126]MBA2811661.1 terpene cyclase/mutase family protein [Streptomyces sp. KM273126]
MNIRRSAAILAATAVAVLGTGSVPVTALADDSSPSASPSQAIPRGLYGSADPTYDGVWRQSLALLAQDTVGVKPAVVAVDWLVGQQCTSGAFAAYRAEASAKCDDKTPVDTNSTAAAVQALAALGGHDGEVGRAVRWLKDVQNEDGGWGYQPGGASDSNSTSAVIGALVAAGDEPEDQKKGGHSPYEALLSLSVPCDEDDGGAFAFQPDKKGGLSANADATTAAVLGSLGKGFVAKAGTKDRTGAGCVRGDDFSPEDAAHNAALYLTKALAEDGYLKLPLAGAEDQPDHGNTADAVVALAAAGQKDSTGEPLAWLEKNSGAWAAEAGPAAYAQLILAAHATGTDPRDFGGADLVKKLNATGPAPEVPDGSTADADKKGDEKGKDDGSVFGVWWIVGTCLVAGIGVGFLLSGRTKKQQL